MKKHWFSLLTMFFILIIAVFAIGCGGDDETGSDDDDSEDGDTADGDVADGDYEDGDTIDGDVADGDTTDGDRGGVKTTYGMQYGGRNRTYHVFAPGSYTEGETMPLVVNMHGFGSNATQQELFSDMIPEANEYDFLIVFPEGFDSSWNGGGSCCGSALEMDIDDVGFIRAMVEEISTKYNVDPKRIYATGMSNGGYMTNRLACDAADLFAAFAPVSAANDYVDCSPSRPVPIVMFNGTTDTLVEYVWGEQTYQDWIERNNCRDAGVTTPYGNSNCITHSTCDGGVKVEFCTLDPMGHNWPGGPIPFQGEANDDIDANKHMIEFMMNFTLP